MKLVYQYTAIFFNFSPTSTHLHSLQVENCDSNSWLVVNEDDTGKFRLERGKPRRAGALVQWVKLPAWKVGHRGFESHPGLQVSKKQIVSSQLTPKNSLLWRAYVLFVKRKNCT